MGRVGCIIYALILGGVGFLFVLPALITLDANAIQLTQLYTGAAMWLLVVVAIGIALLMFLIEDLWNALKARIDPLVARQSVASTPLRAWEYCELIEGKQAGQRQMLKQIRYSEGMTKDFAPDTMPDIVKIMGNEGWELVAAPHTQYANAAAETRWIFRRAR